jgi:hypothetical protein
VGPCRLTDSPPPPSYYPLPLLATGSIQQLACRQPAIPPTSSFGLGCMIPVSMCAISMLCSVLLFPIFGDPTPSPFYPFPSQYLTATFSTWYIVRSARCLWCPVSCRASRPVVSTLRYIPFPVPWISSSALSFTVYDFCSVNVQRSPNDPAYMYIFRFCVSAFLLDPGASHLRLASSILQLWVLCYHSWHPS